MLDSPLLLLGFGVLSLGLFARAWTDPFTQVIGVGPDPPVFIWYLRWIPFAITHGINPLLTSYLDYPGGINVMWQTSIPLLGLLLWPVTALAGPIFAYNLLMTASPALSGWCAFIAFRRHVEHRLAALAGALLFAFSPYMLAQSLGHPHVGVTFICPLMLIAFEEAVIEQRRSPQRLGLAIGLLAAAQLLISEEVLLTQALVGAIALTILASWRPRALAPRLRYLARVALPAMAVTALIAAGPLAVQFLGPQAVRGALPAPNVFVTDLAGVILPTSLQAIAPASLTAITDRFSGSQYEAGAYLGLPLLVVLAIGIRRWWTLAVVRLGAQLLLLALALSIGVTVHIGGRATGLPAGLLALALIPMMRARGARLLPWIFMVSWFLLGVVPLLDNIVASRLTLYVFLFTGLLIAVFIDAALERPRALWRRWKPRIVVGLATLTVLALLPAVPLASSADAVPVFFRSPALSTVPRGSIVLLIPYAHDFESRAMLWQAVTGMRFRMPEGYANRPGPTLDPPSSELGNALIALQQGRPSPVVSAAFRQQALAELKAWRVNAIIVGPMSGQQAAVALISAVVGRPPALSRDAFLWQLGGT